MALTPFVRRQITAAPIGLIIAAVVSFFPLITAAAPVDAPPTVVELFQSQGCSSCPPANANIIAVSERPELLTLSFGVTYWDQLGWKDTFATAQFTQRQWDYAHAFHRKTVFTPQVVINGSADLVGQNRAELEDAIKHAPRAMNAPSIENRSDAVTIGKSISSGRADVWLVRYDPNIVQVPIARGENTGRTLPHKNVVHELLKLGEWSGSEQSYKIPDAARGGLREAVLVQLASGGPILTAARR
ncbi:MAG: DUF1223 domain-containing protein [Rhizomicrobium sp.]|nr:DUF1223 domain-containing protein [Rhizomicrobium sp.]